MLASLDGPDRGRVQAFGMDARVAPPRDYRVCVGYVAQQPAMFEGTVGANVASGLAFRGGSLSEAASEELLRRVGLDGFGRRVARELSAGERLRVALARALANEPRALLLDEPTAALDPTARRLVVRLLRELSHAGTSVLVVSHVAEDVVSLGGTGYRLASGRLEGRRTS